MVTLQSVYDTFLSKVTDDDWSDAGVTEEDLEWMIKDWRALLNQAIPYFKFPKCSLLIDDYLGVFTDERMGDAEVAILTTYMKQQWVKRNIDTWENIKTQYDEKDFSQAHLLNQFIKLKDQTAKEAQELEAIYYRSPNHRPFRYQNLAGGKQRRGR